jgi:nucleotide-binding universal stress UspA family protein
VNYKYIVVPLDGSELAECVLPHLEAVTSNTKVSTVELVRVVQPLEMHYKAALPLDAKQEKQMNAAAIKEAEDYLQKVRAKLDTSQMTVTTKVLTGHVAETLASYLEKSGADLLLIATHGRSGLSRWVMGSTAQRVVEISCVPVLMVRPPTCRPKV